MEREREREREEKEKIPGLAMAEQQQQQQQQQQLQQQQLQQQQQQQRAGSRPGSTTSTPYGSYDQGGYWPGYSAPHYAVAVVPQQQPQSQQQHHGGDEVKHPTSTLRSARRHPQAPHAQQPSHYPLMPSDDPTSRHSHSHDPSHPAHHASLSRTQHRHSYAPYSYPSSTDPSAANSPVSSQNSDYSDDEGPSHSKRASQHAPGTGIGMVGSPPGSGQSHAIGQLQKALAYNFTPSGSPVLGPLKGLTLASAAASRAGSVVHSRAASPIHLPPLKLPPSMERAANGVGIPGSGTSGSGSGSGATSGNGSPENGGPRYDASSHHPHRAQHRARPYGGKSVPGSPVYDAPARGTSGLSPPPMALSRSNAAEADRHRIRDILLHGNMGVGQLADRTLPPISSLGALFNTPNPLPLQPAASTTNAYFPSSNPGSRHPSPPGPGESHFGATTGAGLRIGYGLTPVGEGRTSGEVEMKEEDEEDQLMSP